VKVVVLASNHLWEISEEGLWVWFIVLTGINQFPELVCSTGYLSDLVDTDLCIYIELYIIYIMRI
jgi:hypothetical protein